MLGHARIGYDEAYIKEQIFASKNILYRYIDNSFMLFIYLAKRSYLNPVTYDSTSNSIYSESTVDQK